MTREWEKGVKERERKNVCVYVCEREKERGKSESVKEKGERDIDKK
jgi:hypothetical protein